MPYSMKQPDHLSYSDADDRVYPARTSISYCDHCSQVQHAGGPTLEFCLTSQTHVFLLMDQMFAVAQRLLLFRAVIAAAYLPSQAFLLQHLLLHSFPGLLVKLVYAAADGPEAAGRHPTHLH